MSRSDARPLTTYYCGTEDNKTDTTAMQQHQDTFNCGSHKKESKREKDGNHHFYSHTYLRNVLLTSDTIIIFRMQLVPIRHKTST
eukprot:COSAG05_NODE_1504_length_4692_cov_2.598737_6_plen_85_part_00